MTLRPSSFTPVIALATLLGVWTAPARLAAGQQSGGQTAASSTVRPPRVVPLGFSVVLVVGDLQAGGGEDDVPPAARRALADMKEFLPYKSYKLVDAAWIIGTTNGRSTSRLRGPEDREYELEIGVAGQFRFANGLTTTSPPNDNRISVTFAMRDAGSARNGEGTDGTGADADVAILQAQLTELRDRAHDLHGQQSADAPSVRVTEGQIKEIEARLATARKTADQRRVQSAGRAGGRPVMNTSFSMDIGETVVVGTSRLSGNSKALIALLTAVPSKGKKQ